MTLEGFSEVVESGCSAWLDCSAWVLPGRHVCCGGHFASSHEGYHCTPYRDQFHRKTVGTLLPCLGPAGLQICEPYCGLARSTDVIHEFYFSLSSITSSLSEMRGCSDRLPTAGLMWQEDFCSRPHVHTTWSWPAWDDPHDEG